MPTCNLNLLFILYYSFKKKANHQNCSWQHILQMLLLLNSFVGNAHLGWCCAPRQLPFHELIVDMACPRPGWWYSPSFFQIFSFPGSLLFHDQQFSIIFEILINVVLQCFSTRGHNLEAAKGAHPVCPVQTTGLNGSLHGPRPVESASQLSCSQLVFVFLKKTCSTCQEIQENKMSH